MRNNDFIYLFFNVLLFIFGRETQTQHDQGRGRERQGDTESQGGSRLWAVSTEPNMGLELTNCEIMTWAKVGCLTDWATQAPRFNKKNLIFLRERERERQSVSEGGAERDRETQNSKQAPGSELSVQSLTRVSNSRTVRSWTEPKSDAYPTEPPRCPKILFFKQSLIRNTWTEFMTLRIKSCTL